ncbi:hypothetical protein AHF37_00892 [Paragonimus kellicotti]|nr:hypothetical protein AHF37_00892 [Paragonimus kellicotti]
MVLAPRECKLEGRRRNKTKCTFFIKRQVLPSGRHISFFITSPSDQFFLHARGLILWLENAIEEQNSLNTTDWLSRPARALLRKRNLKKKPVITKFSESGWKFCFYTTMFVYGLYSLHDKSYLYDVRQTLIGYPKFELPPEIYWYYMIEMAYYISEIFWIFYSVRRSDFVVLLVHHMATVGLMSFSLVIYHHRIGSLVLLLHDIADCWMESAKMLKYLKRHQAAEWFFRIFVAVWIVTRLTYFPCWILYTIWELQPPVMYGAYAIIFFWLLLLQVMHIYWFYLILKIAVQIKTRGEQNI